MNVLKQCCYRSLSENKKRTAVTIIGIVLATALITGVTCMAASFRASLIAYEIEQNGDYHYHFVGVGRENMKYFENNTQIVGYGLTESIGYAVLEGSQNRDKPYLYIAAVDEMAEKALSLQLVEGRMPENGSELVIGKHIRSNGMVDLRIGDVLTVPIGSRALEGDELTQESAYYEDETFEPVSEKTYMVVGIIERPNQEVEPRIAPGYSAYTRLENPEEAEILDVYASYTKQGLRNANQVTAGILGVPEDLYERWTNGQSYTEEEGRQIRQVAKSVQENYWLLKWELMIFSSRTMNIMYAMATVAVIIIVVTSVFCIHNSFVISLTEKMKLYGRLASVGTTAAQQRKIVYHEAVFLGMAGIPLGIACGVGATLILVKAVGVLVEDALGFQLMFGTSLPMIGLAAILAMVTIFLSASGSARRAAKISPISAIRANDTVYARDGERNTEKKLRCPKFIDSFFGIGGKIAYKNLRRARVKYRTTVISIVVSVSVFIGMFTFVELMFQASGRYLENVPFQLRASIYDWKHYETALAMAKMDGVEESEIVRSAYLTVDGTKLPFTEEYENWVGAELPRDYKIMVRTLGEEAYARYCEKVGVSVEEAKDKAIVLADYESECTTDGKKYMEEGDAARFRPGDRIQGIGESADIEIEVLLQTKVRPRYCDYNRYNNIMLIVSDVWMENATGIARFDNIEVYIVCEDADRVEEQIRSTMSLQHYTITNFQAQYRADRSMNLVVSIFLYGFITVVALIGITNIFNTITTNMELRAPEFAMLKSVGMTRREFRRMIWLEGVFYGGKSLCVGVPLGVLLSLCFHRALGRGIVTDFRFPWLGIAIAVAAVIALLYLIMRYSMSKIGRRNIIDTIRNENI